jgi:hypothetical protein
MHSLLKLSFYKRKKFPPPSSFPKYPKKLKWLVLGCSTLMSDWLQQVHRVHGLPLVVTSLEVKEWHFQMLFLTRISFNPSAARENNLG